MNGSGILVDAMGMAKRGLGVIIVVTTIVGGLVSGALAQTDAIGRATGLAEPPFNT
jgi:hypothetical protein